MAAGSVKDKPKIPQEKPASLRPVAEDETLVRQAVKIVSEYIRTNALRVGDILPGEKYFAEQLGVSRAVTREAFGALAALRLIEVKNGRKPRVSTMDGTVIATALAHAVNTAQISVVEIWEVRRTIEQRTAALAAAVRTDAEAAEIMAHAQAMAESADDFDRLAEHDVAFHRAIARASHNALFVQIVSSFEPLMEVAVPMAWRTRTTEPERQAVFQNHLAIARAILGNDTGAASAAMYMHFDATVTDILLAMSNAASRADPITA
jgi:GntR family transcriptional repressor for pyruvate dehydrogenase complex